MFTSSEQHGCCSTTNPEQKDHDEAIDSSITTINIVINCFLVNISVIVGSFGNIVTVIVLSRGKIKDTSSILLISMAACDLFFLVNLFVGKLDCIISRFDPVLAQIYYPYIMTFVRRPGRMAAFISFTHTVIISFERVLAVFFPIQVSHWITCTSVLIVLAFVYLVWICAILPYAVANYEIEWTLKKNFTLMLPLLKETKWFIKNRSLFNLISEIINFIIGFFSVVVAANCCAITCKLRYVLRHRSSMASKTSAGNKREAKVSRMLLVVCVVFSLCNLPGCSIYFQLFSNPAKKTTNALNSLLSNIEELMLAINAAANFFVYILLSEKFYKSVVSCIVCRRYKASNELRVRSSSLN